MNPVREESTVPFQSKSWVVTRGRGRDGVFLGSHQDRTLCRVAGLLLALPPPHVQPHTLLTDPSKHACL